MIKILDYRIDPREVVFYRSGNVVPEYIDRIDTLTWAYGVEIQFKGRDKRLAIGCTKEDFESFERQFEEAQK